MNGSLVNWDDAKVHILNQTMHYGHGCFEGIRCYNTDKGPAVFRLDKHIERLLNSSKILEIVVPYSKEDLLLAVNETIKQNNLTECYIRPLVFLDYGGPMGLVFDKSPVGVSIACWKWSYYLGEEGFKNGIRVKISSFTRQGINMNMVHSKCCGNYPNSFLAKREAIDAGYDEALLLDEEGYITEGTGENVFMIKDNVFYTTPTSTVLAGITRASLIVLAKDMGFEVVEQKFTRDELYTADEAFFCGTAAEITPIREVDDRVIGNGKKGIITEQLQNKFLDVVHGKDERHKEWLYYIH